MRYATFATLLVVAACGTPVDDAVVEETDVAVPLTGSCTYNNPFSSGEECKEYRGDGWTTETAATDCDTPLLTAPAGTFQPGEGCGYNDILGDCTIDGDTPDEVVLIFPGTDPTACSGVQVGCTFGSGSFTPSQICEDGGRPGISGNVFQPFTQTCSEPLADEPEGASEGDVCTWNAISACTEPERRYDDYASCDAVVTQRPYVPYEVTSTTAADDPRLDDDNYMNELDWVTDQVEACACICCHSTASAPDGTSGWYIEADPIWTDTLDDEGLAMLAGWVDSTAFGAFPPEDNNGFDRSTTGLPTTDVPRMQAFLESELARRGFIEADFAQTPPFGGPLYDQLTYEPSACTDGEGVGSDGTISWGGGGARYVYVMSQGSDAPGVPPNLDLPAGTQWRIDVPPVGSPLTEGITYGTVPEGAEQTYPATGSPTPLANGETYYLYVLKDVYQPIARCLFTYAE